MAFVADSIAEFCVYEGYVHRFAVRMEELGFKLLNDYSEACPHDIPLRNTFLRRWKYILEGRRMAELKAFARDLVNEITEEGKESQVMNRMEAPNESMLADEKEFPALRAVR